MIVGLDLDNTIVDCDALFQRQAETLLDRLLISKSREAIRDLVRHEKGDTHWTQIQAEVYGPLYPECRPCRGAVEAIASIGALSHISRVIIISHKTLADSAGRNYKLRDYAMRWIEEYLIGSHGPLTMADVYFASTINEKRQMIVDRQCDFFLDDLTDIIVPLAHKISYPVLFSQHPESHPLKDKSRVCDWPSFADFTKDGFCRE